MMRALSIVSLSLLLVGCQHERRVSVLAKPVVTTPVVNNEPDYDAVYSDDFKDNYPVRGSNFDLKDYDQEVPATAEDHGRRVTVFRTNGTRYPAEDQKCVIQVEGRGLEEPRILSASGFRSVTVTWITEKLILIGLDLGPAAAVEAIYDVEKDAWLYRESVTYPAGAGPVASPAMAPQTQ